MATATVYTGNADFHATCLLEEWKKHTLTRIEIDTSGIENHEERIGKRNELMAGVFSDPGLGAKNHLTAPQIATLLLDDLLKRSSPGEKENSVGFGLDAFNEIVFETGCVTYLGARAGMGKTTLLANMIRWWRQQKISIGLFTLEMSTLQMARICIAIDAGVPSSIFRDPDLSNDDHADSIYKAIDFFSKEKIAIAETPGLSIEQLDEGIVSMKRDYPGIKLIAIDHIHIMFEAMNSRTAIMGVTKITGMLKMLSKKHNVGILALAQLNREADKRDDKTPRMADLRESGSIEQDADVILMLYRDSYYYNEEEQEEDHKYSGAFNKDKGQKKRNIDPATKVYVRKNRHGDRSNFALRFATDEKTKRMEFLGEST
jgi:replicative DNA helicase